VFRNDEQLAAVCQALCAQVRLASFWTKNGPSERAKKLLEGGGESLSHGEQIMILCAWALWNGRGDLKFSELVDVLDRGNLTAVGELLCALAEGPEALDHWLGEYPKAE
jgi:hypothetical protein